MGGFTSGLPNSVPLVYKSVFMTVPYFLFYLFIYWLCWVFVAAHGLSLVAASEGYSLWRRVGFSLRWLLFVLEHRL